MKFLFLIITLLPLYNFAQDLNKKPLRTLRVGSNFSFSIDFLKLADGYYFQDGNLTFNADPNFKENQTYCSARVQGNWDYKNKFVEFKLLDITGSYLDPNIDEYIWDKFITRMLFKSKNALLDITCLNKGKRLLEEATIGSFSKTFKNYFRFGNLLIDDNGEFGDYILDPDNLVVTYELMDKISLPFQKDIKLTKHNDMQNGWYVYYLNFDNTGVVEKNNHKKPGCFLWFSVKDKNGIEIPSGERLRFKNHSSGYERTKNNSGLRFRHSSDGYFESGFNLRNNEYKVNLFCNSSREQSALRYSELLKLGSDWIDWILNL